MIQYKVYAYTEVLDNLIMLNNFDNKATLEWAIQNLFIIYFSLIISRLFSILGITTNQANSSSIDPNNVNIGKTNSDENTVAVAKRTSGKKNAVIIGSNIRNKRAESQKRASILL